MHYIYCKLYAEKESSKIWNYTAKDAYFKEINKPQYEILTPKRLRELVIKYQQEKSPARYIEIFQRNQKLVVDTAKHILNEHPKYELMDLIEEGNIGLLDAIDKFDIAKNTCFTTYALYRIRGAINTSLVKNGEKPRSINKIEKFYISYYEKYGQYPDTMTIANTLHKNALTVLSSYAYIFAPVISLDASAQTNIDNNESGLLLNEVIPDKKTDFESDLINKLFIEQMLSHINTNFKISNKTRACEIIKMYNGLPPYNQEIFTFKEIGETFNVKKQRIQQIHSKMIKFLRNSFSEKDNYIFLR